MNRQYYALPENHKSMSERLKDMYVPTAVRRAVTRTFDIVKELKKIQGRDPDKIFIEMARGTGETPKGKRTNSRKDQILEHWHGLDNKDINDLKSQAYGNILIPLMTQNSEVTSIFFTLCSLADVCILKTYPI